MDRDHGVVAIDEQREGAEEDEHEEFARSIGLRASRGECFAGLKPGDAADEVVLLP